MLTLLFSTILFFGIFIGDALAKKTISREGDPVIVTGGKLQGILGLPIRNIGLFAVQSEKLKPVPFQIDQRDSLDRLVLPVGPSKGIDDLPDFDQNDELVFMAKDSGGQASPDMEPAGATIIIEVTLTDPVNDSKGWVYVVAFGKPAPKSKVDYVRYDPRKNIIYAKNYTMGFSAKAPIAIGHLSLTKAGGGNGVNQADRLKIRFRASAMKGMVQIDKNENGFKSKVIAWTDGPVRVIRRTKNRQTLFLKIPTPSAYLDNIYYYNGFEFPTRIDLPFDVDTFLSDPYFRVSTDSLCNGQGRLFFNENNPNPVKVDGVMSPEEKNLNKDPYKWMIVTGTGSYKGGWMNRLLYDRSSPVIPKLYYMDDKGHPDPPEDDPGQCGDVGYTLENLEKVKKGVLNLTSVMYNIPRFEKSDIQKYLNIIDRPIRIKTSQVK